MMLTLETKPLVHSRIQTRTWWNLKLATAVGLILALAVFFRVWKLGNIPGINGDEAWSGVQAMRLVSGQPVAWRTPTGNPVNVFFLLPLAGLHLLFGLSFVVLRAVAVASGLAALLVNYWLCSRVFGRPTAVVSTLTLAVLPVNIAYSRFAWDASQSLLATVLVTYLPLLWLRRNSSKGSLPIGSVLAFMASIVVHPTNIFAMPLVVMPVAYARRKELLCHIRRISLPARPRSLVGLVVFSLILAYAAWYVLPLVVGRLHGLSHTGEFLQNYLRLLSGATVLEYIAGVEAASGPLALYGWIPFGCKVLFGSAVLLSVWGFLRRLETKPSEVDVSLLLGWGTMLLGFAIVAGPGAIVPHLERYGICLIAPAVLALARGLTWWLEPERSHRDLAGWVLTVGAALLLGLFYVGYFQLVEQTGGLSHRAFRTAEVEPKQAAFNRVVVDHANGKPVDIVATEWWIYWPIEYLALGEPGVTVRGLQDATDAEARPRAVGTRDVWYLEFAGSKAEREVLNQLIRSKSDFEKYVFSDYAGRPLISAVKTKSAEFSE